MPLLHGIVSDGFSGQPVAAKVHALDSRGQPAYPLDALHKVGSGLNGFYTAGEFTLDVPVGVTTLLAERGTEYVPFERTVHVNAGAATDVHIPLQRWMELPARGWYPGNTHVHYDQNETRPDDRLHLDPQVHDLRVTIVSILQRGDIPYAINKYPVGLLNDFSTAHHIVDCGEETRHNREAWEIGYGHVIFLNLKEVVQPLSRGLLVREGDPDYPPLCYACDEARRQGGLAIWCHNGIGMEAPVASALRKLDAFNLFDPCWMSPEYEIWYQMLNCGLELPASTGSDWFISSNNRVYVHLDDPFSYQAWIKGLQSGRTFITNGPALFLKVNGHPPGAWLDIRLGSIAECEVSWRSHFPVQQVELMAQGQIVAARSFPEGSQEGEWRIPHMVNSDGWLAARLFGMHRDSFSQPIFAHTSPVWLRAGQVPQARAASARYFVDALDRACDWVQTVGRYSDDRQRAEVLALMHEGQAVFAKMLR
jgi:hypothetical protein